MTQFNCSCADGLYTDTLGDVRTRVLVRCGFGSQLASLPPGISVLFTDFVQDAQKQLYRKYPELNTLRIFTWTMTAGERFYGLQSNDEQSPYDSEYCTKILAPKRVEGVWVQDVNGSIIPLRQGIPMTALTSVANNGLPAAYDIRQCIEVFPAPDQVYTLIMKGHFGLLPFAADADTVTLDEEAIFLLATGLAKQHYQQSDAGTYFNATKSYIEDLTSGAHGIKRYIPGPKKSTAPLVQPNFIDLIP